MTRRHWQALAADLRLPSSVLDRLCGGATDAARQLAAKATPELLDMPTSWVKDVRRRIARRIRDLDGA